MRGDSSLSARLAAADERINRALADAIERHATKDSEIRGTPKRASIICHPESEPQKKIALDTEQESTPHPSVSSGGSAASGTQPSNTISTDHRREKRAQDLRRYDSSKQQRPPNYSNFGLSASRTDSRSIIIMKMELREVRDTQTSVTEQHVARSISKKTTLSEHPVAVTTQEALDGYREKTMRVANFKTNALNRVPISSAGALDMTHCDFSVRSAREEMRHIVGSSEPGVIIGSDKEQNRKYKKSVSCTKRKRRAVATSCMS